MTSKTLKDVTRAAFVNSVYFAAMRASECCEASGEFTVAEDGSVLAQEMLLALGAGSLDEAGEYTTLPHTDESLLATVLFDALGLYGTQMDDRRHAFDCDVLDGMAKACTTIMNKRITETRKEMGASLPDDLKVALTWDSDNGELSVGNSGGWKLIHDGVEKGFSSVLFNNEYVAEIVFTPGMYEFGNGWQVTLMAEGSSKPETRIGKMETDDGVDFINLNETINDMLTNEFAKYPA